MHFTSMAERPVLSGTYMDTYNSSLFNFTTNLFTINVWVKPTASYNHYLMQNSAVPEAEKFDRFHSVSEGI